MLALITTTALTEPLPVPKARAGRLVPARLYRERLILHAVAGRCGRHRQAAQWDVSLGMDRERQLLLAERTARLAICLLAGVRSALEATNTGEQLRWTIERATAIYSAR